MLDGRANFPSAAFLGNHSNSSPGLPNSSKGLLDAARKLADRQLPNGFHLLRVALKPDEPLAVVKILRDQKVLKESFDQGQWEKLGRLIAIEWDGTDEAELARAFDTYQEKVTLQAEAHKVQLNGPFMLWYLLENVGAFLRVEPDQFTNLLGLCGIAIAEFKTALEQAFEPIAEVRILSSDEIEQAVRKEAQHQLRKLRPEPDYHRVRLAYMDFRSFNALNALNENREHANPKLPLFYGPRGSPIAHLPDVIVDGIGGQKLEEYPYLQECDGGVYSLDIQALADLSSAPHRMLEYALEAVNSQAGDGKKSLVMLEHIEALVQPGVVWDEFRKVLNRPASGQVFAIYIHDKGESDQEVAAKIAAMRLTNVQPCPIGPLTIVEEIQSFLDYIYMPRWEEQGCRFAEGAFKHIFDLEPGATFKKRLIANPYLAVEIGEAAVLAARNAAKVGPALFKGFAGEALQALNHVRATMQARLQPFDKALTEASAEISSVHEDGSLKQENGKYIVTRAHVTMQLFCGEFAFDPPHAHAPKPKKHH